MSNFPYSLAATVYFSILAVALLVLGSHGIRSVVMISLFLGAMSQFVMQGNDAYAELHSNIMAYCAIALILIAIVMFLLPVG